MAIKITIFANGLSPKEHLYGLILAATKSNQTIIIQLVGKLDEHILANIEPDFDKKHIRIPQGDYIACCRAVASSDLVFGMPSSLSWMRILSAIGVLKFIPYFFGPGFVAKAVGAFKHPERGLLPALKTTLKFYLFNTRFICANEVDRVYLSAALGYPLTKTVTAPLPKYIFMNESLLHGDEKAGRNSILFAPTHRWDDVIPPVTTLLTDSDFVDYLEIKGFDILHSRHPDTAVCELDKRVTDFNKSWSKVACIVTDYSSIGDDYLLSGGQNVIAFVSDKQEFESKQGTGPLFDLTLREKIVVSKLSELREALDNFMKLSPDALVEKIDVGDYFQNLLLLSKNGK